MSRLLRLLCAALLVIGSVALIQLLRFTGDAAPELDGTTAVLSVIATWWLAQSYLQQWLLWIVANILSTALCIHTGQYWMAVLYAMYTASAIYGYFHWEQHGKFVQA